MGNKKLILVCIYISVQDCDSVTLGSQSFPGKSTFLKDTLPGQE